MPQKAELREEALGGNCSYEFFGDLGWDDAKECLSLERLLLKELRGTDDEEAVKHRVIAGMILGEETTGLDADAIEEAVYNGQGSFSDDEAVFYALDSGCAAAVCSLYAAGCAPVSSCNGGFYGGYHQYDAPTIVFYANPRKVDLLNAAAECARVVIEPGQQGIPVLIAASPQHVSNFAQALIDLHKQFEAAPNTRKHPSAKSKLDQPELPPDQRP